MTGCSGRMYFPALMQSGLPLSVRVCLEAYPAPDWSAQWLLRGPQSINIDASAVDSAHVFSVSATETGTWLPGRYWYSLRVVQAEMVQEIERAAIEVEPDFAKLPTGYDGRSPFQIALEAIDAVLAKRATLDQQRYRINNRELWRTPMSDLLKLRAYYAARVREESARRNGRAGFGRSIPVRFTS